MPYKLVIIIWRDIVYDAGWHTQKQFDDFVTKEDHDLVNQVGFVVEDDENQIVIVDSYFQDSSAYGTIHKIPKGCIVSMKELKICK